ncbi:LuxR C-terminal-related transcriptional regulator [Actinomadura oligospora]|uniref:LuxR C-terminal-related transcriptional regulator n=1 Tax=Actinomadura oligospora TaxID=111804 RepID=UPI00047BAA29|nr:LuxR C-terminal-related transcriptional regulator [Actinomadura oligospora]
MTEISTLLPHTSSRDGLLRLLRQAHEKAGLPSLRTLEQRAQRNGTPVSKSSLSDLLAGRRLPSPGVVGAYLRACGIDDPAELAEWEDAWIRASVDPSSQKGREPDAAKGQPPPSDRPEGRFAMVMVLNIADFGAPWRDDDARVHVRSALFGALRSGFGAARIPWADVHHEDRGDGALVIAPPDAAPEVLVGPVVTEIARQVRRHNRLSSAIGQLRVRIALHVGYVLRDRHGFCGHALVLPFRLLDAGPFKQKCTERAAEVGVILSDYLYDEMVRNGVLDPGDYLPQSVHVKETVAQGWIRLLGEPSAPSDPLTSARVAVLVDAASPALTTGSGHPISTADAPHKRYGLSAREAEILELVAEGLSNPQIANRVFISEKTVKNHLNRIFTKLNVTNRADAVEVWCRGASRADATG